MSDQPNEPHDSVLGVDPVRPHRRIDPTEGRPQHYKNWEQPFLQSFVEWGSIAKACKIAGVARATVYEQFKRSPKFKADFQDARRAFRDGLEEDLVRLGRDHKNVIAILARLKKEMPEKYHEKLQVEGRMAHLKLQVTISPDEAKHFLAEMLQFSMPETRRALAGEVIDVGPAIESQDDA